MLAISILAALPDVTDGDGSAEYIRRTHALSHIDIRTQEREREGRVGKEREIIKRRRENQKKKEKNRVGEGKKTRCPESSSCRDVTPPRRRKKKRSNYTCRCVCVCLRDGRKYPTRILENNPTKNKAFPHTPWKKKPNEKRLQAEWPANDYSRRSN